MPEIITTPATVLVGIAKGRLNFRADTAARYGTQKEQYPTELVIVLRAQFDHKTWNVEFEMGQLGLGGASPRSGGSQ